MSGISKTVVSIKPGKIAEANKYVDSQAHLVTELDGIIGFAVAKTGDNELTIIGVYESTDAATAASPVVQEVFAEMAAIVAAPPERGVFSGAWFSS